MPVAPAMAMRDPAVEPTGMGCEMWPDRMTAFETAVMEIAVEVVIVMRVGAKDVNIRRRDIIRVVIAVGVIVWSCDIARPDLCRTSAKTNDDSNSQQRTHGRRPVA